MIPTVKQFRARAAHAPWAWLTVLAACLGLSSGMALRLVTQPTPASTHPVSLMVLNAPQDATPHQLIHVVGPAASPQGHADPADHSASARVLPDPSPAVPQFAELPRSTQPAQDTGPSFNGKPLVAQRTIRMLVTAYSPDHRSCGPFADGKTASGKSVWTNGMKLVAADTRLLPFNTIISIPGYNGGKPVQVLDRGGAIKGKRLDVLYPTHEIARQWGKQWLEVTVYETVEE